MSQPLSTAARVRVFGLVVLFLASGATIWAGLRNRPPAEPPPPTTPETALTELKDGNERFKKSQRTRSVETRTDGERRKELAKGQRPIAAVLSCADSRVVPEFLFDQGLGRIFDVSNAGNVVDGDVLGSLEYAVEHLHVPLIVVLGHKGCGAVEAVAKARRIMSDSPVLRDAVKKKETALAVGLYDLESGAVEWQDFDPDAEK